GRIFLGDLRSLPLAGALYTAIELAQAVPELPLARLAARIATRRRQEEELLVEPRFFAALRERLPEIVRVEVYPKRGRAHNELTAFRYQVVLQRAGEAPAPLEPGGRRLDWVGEGWTLAALRRLLEREAPEVLVVQGVPNARVARAAAAARLLAQGGEGTVGELRARLAAAAPEGVAVEPEDLWQLGRDLPYEVELGWAAPGQDGTLEIALRHRQSALAASAASFLSPPAAPRGSAPGDYANRPAHSAADGRIVRELRALAAERLPLSMQPAFYVLVDAFPLTPSGKIDRRALPSPLAPVAGTGAPGEGGGEGATAPRTRTELALLALWRETLGLDTLGVRDNFFTLGGHSLLAVRLLARIEEHFGRTLPLAEIFQRPTVEELAVLLEQGTPTAGVGGASRLVPLQPQGSRAPFFCVHPIGGTVFCYQSLARHLGADQPFYGLQARGVEAGETPLETVEEMAAEYLAALRAVQPGGPYNLGGWSFGGLVAYEMARQLAAGGETCSLLALIDKEAPGSLPAGPPGGKEGFDPAALLVAEIGLTAAAEELRDLRGAARLHRLTELAVQAGWLPAGNGEAVLGRILRVLATNFAAGQRYRPGPYGGPLLLLKAAEVAGEPLAGLAARDPSYGWDRYTVEPVVTRTVPGDHFSLLREPHARSVARVLRQPLDRSGVSIPAGLDLPPAGESLFD
ncbi:MAG TPA: thioesterase domain-containing protein, partial [Thermoanaerobaculia bacterium]|nr:thioesterase domain-containing protein [Thermoanaerobaculia bacterium]